MQVVVVSETWWHVPFNNSYALEVWQRPWVSSKMSKQLLLAEKDRRIALLHRLPGVDAEHATIENFIGSLHRQMTLLNKPEPEANALRGIISLIYLGSLATMRRQ